MTDLSIIEEGVYDTKCEAMRKIFVFHISDFFNHELKVDENPCTSKDFLNYNIYYKFLLSMNKYGKNFQYIKEEIESFSAKLIEEKPITPLNCIAILVVIDDVSNKTILTYFPPELHQIMTVYNTVYFSESSEKLEAMKPIKIRNLLRIDENEIVRINETDVLFGKFFWNSTDILGCKWWFKYYLSNVFLCASNRLRQYTGTCYVNAALNGFIMSESTRKQILLYIHKMNPEILLYIKEPIELTTQIACVDFRNEAYFFRLFYNAICRKENFTDTLYTLNLPEKTDFFKDYFTSSGFSSTIIINMLKFLTQSEIINIQPSVADPPIDWNPSCPFLVHNIYENIETTPIPFEYIFHDVVFDIEFAVLFAIAKFLDNENHALLAYRCNGICKIYDSNNYFYDFDWQNPTKEEVDQLLAILKSIYKYPFAYIYTESILFIRQDVKSELNSLKIPNLCKE